MNVNLDKLTDTLSYLRQKLLSDRPLGLNFGTVIRDNLQHTSGPSPAVAAASLILAILDRSFNRWLISARARGVTTNNAINVRLTVIVSLRPHVIYCHCFRAQGCIQTLDNFLKYSRCFFYNCSFLCTDAHYQKDIFDVQRSCLFCSFFT